MHAASLAWLERAIPSGEYLGWLAYTFDEPAKIVGGVGVLLRNAPPTITNAGAVRTGVQALVINVFTEAAWRKQGVARLLMDALLDECHARNVLNIVLHAAPDGRHLYETLGFMPTNEMRLGG
jgi:GNAT superfamily N-acetyltransferase